MKLAVALAALLTIAALTVDSHAGEPHGSCGTYPQTYTGLYGYPGGFYGGYGVYHHASTYEEGVLRGYADVVRSRGAYNLATSLARINNEQARRLASANKQLATETYFELRRINREARAEARAAVVQRPSAEDIARFARDRAPQPLSPGDFDPEGARLAWPAALTTDTFHAERTQIDALVADRRKAGAAVDPQIRLLAVQLAAKLKREIKSFSPAAYLAAKKFVVGLQQPELLPAAADARVVAR